jgi:hypothetical protein
MKKTVFIILTAFCANLLIGQSFHDEINKIYGGFVPHEVSNDIYNKKMKQFDSLWILIKSDTLKYIVELRNELQRNDNPGFFYYDCGALLESISNIQSDQIIALKALSKADLDIRDVNSDVYFRTLRRGTLKQIDIIDLAIKILDKNNYDAYILEHAFTIEKDYCLYYLLIPQDPQKYVPKLINRYKAEKNLENKKAIVNMLWHSCSCSANDFLFELFKSPKTDNKIKDLLNDLVFNSTSDTKPRDKKYAELLKRREEVYSIITDYTIKEVIPLTKKIRKYNCL